MNEDPYSLMPSRVPLNYGQEATSSPTPGQTPHLRVYRLTAIPFVTPNASFYKS
jgi:hypothetical protein